MEDALAAWSGGVDRLLQAPEPDPTLGQPGDCVNQVSERPAQSVQLPHDQGVAGPELIKECSRAGRSVRVQLAVSVNTR